MAGPLDHQVGTAVESTYGTPVTVTRFYEVDIEGTTHEFDPKRVQGSGMQVGTRGRRADRSVSVVGQSTLTLAMDATSKGLGSLYRAAFGYGVSTLVSTSLYQQLFHTGMTGALLDSLTAQYGIVRSDASGTVDTYTYPGATVTGLDLACDAGDILKAKFTLDAQAPSVVTALASASYPALVAPFHFGQGAATLGGSLTLPTTTALASGGTAAPNIRKFSLSLDQGANTDRWRFGGRNQPRVGIPTAKIKLTSEYDLTTLRDALLQHTTLPLSLTFTSSEVVGASTAALQVVAPACKIPSGALPQPSEDPIYELDLEALVPTGGGQLLYLVTRTADTAL